MKNLFIFLCLFIIKTSAWAVPQYYATGANSLYFRSVLNLIGTIHKSNYENLEEIAVFNLGMSSEECEILKKLNKVTLHELKDINPDFLKNYSVPNIPRTYLGWYAWKPIAIKKSLEKFPYVLWIDAGCAVLKPMDDLFSYIKREGYFLCTSGDELKPNDSKHFQHPIGWGATSFVRNKFHLNEAQNSWILDKEPLMAGFVGVSAEKSDLFLNDWVGLTEDIKNFADDGTTPDGWGTCRHDQTLLSILAYAKKLQIHVKDQKQIFPINIGLDNLRIPLYLTWDASSVDSRTVVQIRSELSNFEENLKAIKYKNPL